jgi:hypothetical protein
MQNNALVATTPQPPLNVPNGGFPVRWLTQEPNSSASGAKPQPARQPQEPIPPVASGALGAKPPKPVLPTTSQKPPGTARDLLPTEPSTPKPKPPTGSVTSEIFANPYGNGATLTVQGSVPLGQGGNVTAELQRRWINPNEGDSSASTRMRLMFNRTPFNNGSTTLNLSGGGFFRYTDNAPRPSFGPRVTIDLQHKFKNLLVGLKGAGEYRTGGLRGTDNTYVEGEAYLKYNFDKQNSLRGSLLGFHQFQQGPDRDGGAALLRFEHSFPNKAVVGAQLSVTFNGAGGKPVDPAIGGTPGDVAGVVFFGLRF